jgi:hypothetical protein
MYVAKIDRRGIFWYAKLFEKKWSDQLYSNRIELVDQKKFITRYMAKKWYKKKVLDLLIENKELEIHNG